MKITACPKCGSRRIFQGRLKEGVLTGYSDRYVCRECGYQGSPIIFDTIEEYNKFLMEIKQDKSIDELDEKIKDIKLQDLSDLSEKEKQVINFLKEDEKKYSKDDIDLSEKQSKLLKNTCTSLGIVLLVVGILITASIGNLLNIPFMLIIDGVLLFIIGLFLPAQERLQDENYKLKIKNYPKVAGGLMIINALTNGFFYLILLLYISNSNMITEDLIPNGLDDTVVLIQEYQILFLVVLTIWLILCVFLLVGGIFSLKNKRWGIALIGGILGTFLFPLFYYIPSIVSIIAVILIAYSRSIFEK